VVVYPTTKENRYKSKFASKHLLLKKQKLVRDI